MKKRYIDLHTHTMFSDGIDVDPYHLVSAAGFNGIDIFAITDHDNTEAHYHVENKYSLEKYGMILLPGAEITTEKYHLLALNFDPNNNVMKSFLEHSQRLQSYAFRERIDRLSENGIPISYQQVRDDFPRNTRIGKYNIFVSMWRDPIVRKIMQKQCPDVAPLEVFRHYFGKNGIASDINRESETVEDAILYTHKAHGIIGIAHPIKDINNLSELDHLLELGMDFIEIQPGYRGRETGKVTTEEVEEYARIRRIPISFGSDYHGPTFDRTILGRGENILSRGLEKKLNKGFVKVCKDDFDFEEDSFDDDDDDPIFCES